MVLFSMTLYSCLFFKQKTAYEMRISDWSSDVCSSDLDLRLLRAIKVRYILSGAETPRRSRPLAITWPVALARRKRASRSSVSSTRTRSALYHAWKSAAQSRSQNRSEEHTSELQSLMRISYAVFCLKKKTKSDHNNQKTHRAKRTVDQTHAL